MKKIFFTLLLLAVVCQVRAQALIDTTKADTTKAIQIIDKYVRMVDFERENSDSMLCVVSSVVDNASPNDTITIYRWYQSPRLMRVEFWQNGKMQDGYYSDGTNVFRKFRESTRSWDRLTQDSFYDITRSLDIRGALYDWRIRGAEVFFVDELDYEGNSVYRVYVTCPGIFDRYYYFEKATGLLFLATEEDHIYGDAEKFHNAQRVDMRAWHEFTPVHGFLLPSVESYRIGHQTVVINHSYHYEAAQPKLFTDDYRKK